MMTLSTADNPLTAFNPLPKGTPTERVLRRFAVDGNVIGADCLVLKTGERI